MDFTNVSFALKWILFLGLFPMSFLWLRRAYRVFIKKDYSEVALKSGDGPEDPKKWAPYTGIVNLAAGSTALFTIIGILWPFLNYETWSKIAGITLWMKIFADYIVSRTAHPFKINKKKVNTAEK
jgi:hypothetical protein